MRIGTKFSVALHCLIFIGVFENQMKVTGKMLAVSTGSNPVIIRTVLGALQKQGIVKITRGTGGARLARTPGAITLWQVYQAVEPERLSQLIGIHPHPSPVCPVGRQIRRVLSIPYAEVEADMQHKMETLTLQGLIDSLCTEA